MFEGQNNSVSSLIHQAGPVVTDAIHKAANATGVDFSYLMKKAKVESGFDADAKSSTSSARGLYQFLDKTWMSMVKKYGDKYGMANLADQIDDTGHCDSASVKKQILSLRDDPEKSACLAAEYDSENKNYLAQHAGSDGSATDLYMAHFMGAGAAASFLNSMKDNPLQTAATLFPKAAAANHNIFYGGNGSPKTLAQVYSGFSSKFGAGDAVASDTKSSGDSGVLNAMRALTASAADIQSSGDAQTAMASLGGASFGGAISPVGGGATRMFGSGGGAGSGYAPALSPNTSINLHALHMPAFASIHPVSAHPYRTRT